MVVMASDDVTFWRRLLTCARYYFRARDERTLLKGVSKGSKAASNGLNAAGGWARIGGWGWDARWRLGMGKDEG
jgi:hypothetical protein